MIVLNIFGFLLLLASGLLMIQGAWALVISLDYRKGKTAGARAWLEHTNCRAARFWEAWVRFSDLQKRIESCRSVSRAPIYRINMTGRAAAVMPLQLSRDFTFSWEMRMKSIMAVPARMPPRIRTYFANARYRTVTASARVQDLSGLKVVAEVPVVIPFS